MCIWQCTVRRIKKLQGTKSADLAVGNRMKSLESIAVLETL